MADKTTKSVTQRTTYVNLKSPKAVADFSKELKEFIVNQKLYVDIKGKNYVLVEGWQFAGASMGIFAIPESVEDISPDGITEKKWRAEVVLKEYITGTEVGRGFAVCSSLEPMRKGAEEFALVSMAQTRATGKAYRLTIGWIMKLAGYEATPAEEIKEYSQAEATNEIPIEDIKQVVIVKLNNLDSVEKMRLLKNTGHTDVKKLEDVHWRMLYADLSKKETKK